VQVALSRPVEALTPTLHSMYTHIPTHSSNLNHAAAKFGQWGALGLSGTHYADVVEHNDDGGLKVTDPQGSTMSSLKERELRS